GEADEIAALLRLFAFLVEPDADFGTAGDLFADRVDVLIPRDPLARQHQFAGAWTIQVVALADRPLHQLRARVDDLIGIGVPEAAARTAGRALIHGFRIVLQHEVRDRVMDDLARLEARGTNLDELDPARLGQLRHLRRRTEPDVLVLRRHRVLRRL